MALIDTGPRPGPTWLAALFSGIVLPLLLVGCAGSAFTPVSQSRPSPQALIDSYLIAHGMALGYGRSGRAGPAEIAQLIQYDRAAMIAVANATMQPGGGRTTQAQSAVSAMVRYTGEEDLTGIPAPDAIDR